VPISDTTTVAVEYALRGLELRADVRAHNVANQNTPGFRAGRVDFESVLRSALQGGRPGPATEVAEPAVQPGMSLPQPYQNTVNLEDELVGMIKDNLARDAIVNAYNAKVGLFRAAIGSA
jgi:flagellar basal-body rod protein FlgB